MTLYEHSEFRGRSETFTTDVPSLKDNPFGQDSASSLRIDPGCEVTLYRHIQYEGKSTVLTEDAATLRGTRVGNDRVSSLKVRCQ